MKNRFIELFKETLEIEDRELQMKDIFRDYEEWNSLAYLSLIAMIDEEYEVLIEGVAFKNLLTLDELYAEIQTRIH